MNNYDLLKKIKVFYENINDIMNLENLELDDNYSSFLENTKSMLSKLYSNVYTMINNNNEKVLKTDSVCYDCLDKLKISDLIDYDYVCEKCDENFYNFEVTDKDAWYKETKSVIKYKEINSLLEKGGTVEISSCAINNDVGGTIIIRNSRFKDEVDGMNITIEYPNGNLEHTKLESTDKLVQLPIEVEILEKFYDYEVVYKYKGKILNEDLIKEVSSLGITGHKLVDYKKYNNKEIYEDVKKAMKNYNPSIVYFSESDIVKIIEKDENKNIGIEL